MNSSSFSSSLSYSSSSSSSAMEVTREEFNAFHKIDRDLFTRLVFGLNRDMNQSCEVFGFLFFLEQAGYVRNLIAYLVSLPDASIDVVANEIVVCLTFLYNKEYSTTFFLANNNNDGHSIIPLIIRMTGGKLTLTSIHQNREVFLLGLNKNLNNICIRAFEDICTRAERYNKEKLLALERENVTDDKQKIRLSVQQELTNKLCTQQERAPPPLPLSPPHVKEETYKTAKVTKNEDIVVLDPDDRTVFLTFSKGYPISEEEVRVYFTRRFGEVIETIEMQEVELNEQPLYARMVLMMRYASKIEEIVTERSKNKFTIDGKHVWARKYVRKNPTFASSSSYA